jgi:tetratricopeptide (TPR) repeat protein
VNEARYADAAELARAGVERYPDDENLRYAWAFALWNVGDDEGSLRLLDLIAASGDDLAKAREALRSVIFRKRGRLAEAVNALDALLAIDPGHVDSLLMRAALMESQGRLDEQERSLRAAYEADPSRGAVPLSTFYLRARRYDEAALVADQALRA